MKTTVVGVVLAAAVVPAAGLAATCGPQFGDLNGDGFTSVVDAQCGVVGALWALSDEAEPMPVCLVSIDAADLSCDSELNVVDVQMVIAEVLSVELPTSVDADSDGCPDACSGDGPVPLPKTSANVYWVGHSLVTGEDPHVASDEPLDQLMGTLVNGAGLTYDSYRHTTPGAPIGWNWGGVADAWFNGSNQKIQPLINPDHPDYGTFDAIVVTEGVSIQSSYDWWYSGFYARRFYCAALAANPDAELFLYESWHHMQATDETFASYYGVVDPWDFVQYQIDIRPTWDAIADEAADPALTPVPFPGDYTWFGGGSDPGDCGGVLDVYIVPTGQALVALFERLQAAHPGDDWSYPNAAVGGQMSALDLFLNPYSDYPANTTTVHGGVVDDIHPSHLLVYLNALVHYATVYRRDPAELPVGNEVPANLKTLFAEVAWETVLDDPRSGVAAP